MKKLVGLVLLTSSFMLNAQTNSELISHFDAYYKQMKTQGDVQGIINAMTHLNVLQPSVARQDTLAYIYMSEGKYVQALNTIGIVTNPEDSDIAVEVKAISLKAVGQPKMAYSHFTELFKRESDPMIAYELAEIAMQLQKFDEADKHIAFGLANAKDDMKRAYYERQTPYEVPLKAGFMYLNALSIYNKDKKANIDLAVDELDAAFKIAPNFNMLQLTKNELLRQKQVMQSQTQTE
ncbi:hypothetical protein KFZ70_06735 [Tamlana fucoidanivorans]|uniref:Tetratricopeptide repeat protein n=1 Tax=Allotamlana fucoidanivorans TaxID=2583814 RepID=A0A5C4SMI2_9FLAO|nr:hypothetical protein [Tamlana fucoidanivorans]TNJ45293.1 hypothetical protein FGF67_06170 [Tamlana fucoidanivorans]